MGERYDEKNALLQEDLEAVNNDEKTYSINECMETLGFGWFQVKLTVVVGCSWMADAIAITLLAVLGPTVQCYWNLSSEKTAIISTCVFTGMFFGCWFWGWLCDNFGRRLTISLSMIWILVFGIFSAVAPHYIWLLIAMLLQGFGVGGVGQSMTMYSEFLPSKFRAGGIIFINLFYVMGNICSAIMAYLTMRSFGWRWFIITSCIPILLYITILWWLPESPRYLVAAGKTEEASKILERVSQANNKKMPQGRLSTVPCYLRKPRGRVSDLLSEENRKTTLILWALWFTSIFSYYGVILFTTILLNKKGSSCGLAQIDINNIPSLSGNQTSLNNCHSLTNEDYLGYMFTAFGEIPGLFLTFVLAEKLGRKAAMALLFFASLCTISFLHICMKRIAIVALIFVLRAFLTGVVQTVYLYTPEVYPTNIRAIGLGTASGMARLGAIVTPFVSQVLLESSPHLAVLTYSVLMFICVGGALVLPKETKGKQLEEIDE